MDPTVFVLDALIPIIVALFKQSGFPSAWNNWIAIAIYAIWTAVSLALGIRAVDGPVTPEIFLSQFVLAATIGFASYNVFWKLVGEKTLEHATSVVKGPVSDPVFDDAGDHDPAVQG